MRKKLAFVGTFGAGKTSLVKRFIYDTYVDTYVATIGVDFFFKTLISQKQNQLKLQIWDTGVDSRFRALKPIYMRDSQALVLVLDGTKTLEEQKEDIQYYLNQAKIEGIKPYIAVNKSDTLPLVLEIEKLKKDYNVDEKDIYLCSAKNGDNVKELFCKIAQDLVASDLEKNKIDLTSQTHAPEYSKNSTSLIKNIKKAILPIVNHPYWAGGNGFILAAAITLFTLAAFTAGSFLTFGILPSAFLGAAIIIGAASLTWNAICYGMNKQSEIYSKVKEPDQTPNLSNGMQGLGEPVPEEEPVGKPNYIPVYPDPLDPPFGAPEKTNDNTPS